MSKLETDESIEVTANPGYYRVRYNNYTPKKPSTRGISLEEALNRVGGKPIHCVVEGWHDK